MEHGHLGHSVEIGIEHPTLYGGQDVRTIQSPFKHESPVEILSLFFMPYSGQTMSL